MKRKIFTKEAVDKLIHNKYSSALMNNSKWVKLIQKLVDNHEIIGKCYIKLVYDEKIRELKIQGYEQYNLDFYQQALESMVTEVMSGWTYYKEIEWISFPRDYEHKGKNKQQNIKNIAEVIYSIGQFNESLTEESFTIYGYK